MTIKYKIENFEEFCRDLSITNDSPSVETVREFIDSLGFVQMLKECHEFIDESGLQFGARDILNKIDNLIKNYENI